jgi:hypothetical protein
MAYNMKDVFYLDTGIDTGTSTGDGLATLDLSSYVDPIARGRAKGTGLAIYKVHFDRSSYIEPITKNTNRLSKWHLNSPSLKKFWQPQLVWT